MRKKEEKRQMGIRLFLSSIDYINEVKELYGLNTFTAAIERIISEHRAKSSSLGEETAALVMQKIDDKYGKALTRIRLGTNAADVNSQVMLEIINSFAINNAFNIGDFVPTSTVKATVVEEAEQTVKKKIAYYKQLKDSKSRVKNDEE